MNKPIIYGFNEIDGTMMAEEDVRLTELHLRDKVIKRTCEHCGFWTNGILLRNDHLNNPDNWQCSNPSFYENFSLSDPYIVIYLSKDFGCIFWEGKE